MYVNFNDIQNIYMSIKVSWNKSIIFRPAKGSDIKCMVRMLLVWCNILSVIKIHNIN